MRKIIFILLVLPSLAFAEFTTDVLKLKDASGDICSISGSLTANRTLTVPDVSGTICTTGSVCAGYQASDADLTTWAGITPGAGVGTFLATPSSANLATAVTDETGSGALVFGTNPTLSMSTGSLLLPSSTSLPGTCSTGQFYMDTDATSGQRLYACESANTWVQQGGGGGGSGDITDVGDCTTGACFNGTTGTTLTFNNAGGDATLNYDGTDLEFNKSVKIAGTTSNMLYVTGSSYPVEFVERTPSGSSGAWATQKLKTTYSAGDVTTEFGPVTIWTMEDSAAVENGLGYIGALRSGGDTSGAVVLGTFNSGSQAEKMRITPSGSVGIGATAPSSKLEIKGDGTTTGESFSTTNSSGTKQAIILDNGLTRIGSGATANAQAVKLEVVGSVAPGTISTEEVFKMIRPLSGLHYPKVAAIRLGQWYATGVTSHSRMDFALKSGSNGTYDADATIMSLFSDNRVGIGTTAPDKILEINGASGGAIRLTYNDSNGSAATYSDMSVDSSGDLTLAPSGGDVTSTGTIKSSATGSLGWSIVLAANQACTTTCTSAAVHGWDTSSGEVAVDASDATADKCLCAGAS